MSVGGHKTFYRGKRILITGGGSLGRGLVKRLLEYDVLSIKVLDNSEQALFKCEQEFREDRRISYIPGDISHYDTLEVPLLDVDYVIHTASGKFVNYVEYYPYQCIHTNIHGTMNMIQACMRSKTIEKMICIGSDKGCDAISIYGLTKALQEHLMMWASRNSPKVFCSIRFPNFKESDGSVFQIWSDQIRRGLPLTITDENMYRYFISLEDAANLTLQALKMARRGELFIPSECKEQNIMDLAKMYGDNYKIIGKRPGERLRERLMRKEEQELAERINGLWVIDTSKIFIGTPRYLYDTYEEDRK